MVFKITLVILLCGIIACNAEAPLSFGRYRQNRFSARQEVKENSPTPYPAAGFRPSGRQFNLPSEERVLSIPKQRYGAPINVYGPPDNAYGPPQQGNVNGEPNEDFPPQSRPQPRDQPELPAPEVQDDQSTLNGPVESTLTSSEVSNEVNELESVEASSSKVSQTARLTKAKSARQQIATNVQEQQPQQQTGFSFVQLPGGFVQSVNYYQPGPAFAAKLQLQPFVQAQQFIAQPQQFVAPQPLSPQAYSAQFQSW